MGPAPNRAADQPRYVRIGLALIERRLTQYVLTLVLCQRPELTNWPSGTHKGTKLEQPGSAFEAEQAVTPFLTSWCLRRRVTENSKLCDSALGSTDHKGAGCRKNLSLNENILR